MLHVIKLFFIVFRSLIFENKDEWNIKSPNFKPKKMITFILIVLSFILNVVLGIRFYQIVNDCVIQREPSEKIVETRAVKKPTVPPSDD